QPDRQEGRHAQLFCRVGGLGRSHLKALVGLTLVFGSIAPQTPHSRLEGLSRRLRHPGERLQQQSQRIDDLERRLLHGIERRLGASQERLARLDTRLGAQHPGRTLTLLRQRLEHLSGRMPRAMQESLNSRRQHLQGLAQTLNAVSPLATLSRGYSILLDERGQAVRCASQTLPGQRLKARLGEGELDVRVEDNHLQPVTLPLL
ncbi:hypothetical protein FVE88_08825, partial [Ectopseudomonas mendocina]